MKSVMQKQARRIKRKKHIRKSLTGTAERPRISVYRSNKHMYIQAIDDQAGKTLVSVSTMSKDFSKLKNNVADAVKLGEAMGEKLKAAKIKTAVFDRNGYLYHGIVKAIADGTRKSGIEF